MIFRGAKTAPGKTGKMNMEKGALSGRVIGGHEILEIIGRGAQGEVYRCRCRESGELRAIKLLRVSAAGEDALRRMEQEVGVLQLLDHDNVVKALKWVEDHECGVCGIVMECLSGKNLKQEISSRGGLSVQKTLEIAIQVGRALTAAHRQGVIHRDVKSTNIIFKDDQGVKIGDFGIARFVSAEGFTRTRLMLGTIDYMSPEQIRGEKHIDARTDIYSLAIVIYEMLTGELPFTGETEYAVQEKQLRSRPVPPGRKKKDLRGYCPPSLENAVLKALEKEPARRPQTMAVFVRTLETVSIPRVREHYALGVAAFKRTDYGQARRLFGQVLEIDERYEDARSYYDRIISATINQDTAAAAISGEEKKEPQTLSGRTVGDYEICERIGTGGQGTVYRCRHLVSGRECAVKFLHAFPGYEGALERFRREAEAMRKLEHEGIVRALDWVEDQAAGLYGIAMEYLSGQNLKQVLISGGALPLARAVDVARQVGEALSYAHARGVIHRDVKPANIIMAGSVRVKLTDFGIARLVSSDKFTRTRLMLGTVEYMSPEQIRGAGHVGERSDIYSLGIVLYEMLTGRLPFTGNTEHTVQEKQLKNRPHSLRRLNRHIPRCLEKLVIRALSKDPSRRQGSMKDFLEELSLSVPVFEALPATPPARTWTGAPDGPGGGRTEIIRHGESDTSLDGAGSAAGFLMARARLMAGMGNHRAALKMAGDVLAGVPGHPEAVRLREESLVSLGQARRRTLAIAAALFFSGFLPVVAVRGFSFLNERSSLAELEILVAAGEYRQAFEYFERLPDGLLRGQRLATAEKIITGARERAGEVTAAVTGDIALGRWPDDDAIAGLRRIDPFHPAVLAHPDVSAGLSRWDEYRLPPAGGDPGSGMDSIANYFARAEESSREGGGDDDPVLAYARQWRERVAGNIDWERRALAGGGVLPGHPPAAARDILHPEILRCFDGRTPPPSPPPPPPVVTIPESEIAGMENALDLPEGLPWEEAAGKMRLVIRQAGGYLAREISPAQRRRIEALRRRAEQNLGFIETFLPE